MSNDNSGFFYKFKTLRSIASTEQHSLVGELNTTDENNDTYFYMKDDNGVALSEDSSGYHCITVKISIPDNFFHVKYRFNQRTKKGDILGDTKVEIGGENLRFMANITNQMDNAKNVIQVVDGKVLNVDSMLLRGKSFTIDFKDREFIPGSSPARLKGCGGDTGFECRKCFKYQNNTQNKVFCTKSARGKRTFYIPTLGKTKNNFSDVIYFKIEEEEELWRWLAKAQQPLAGIAVSDDIPDPEDLGGVMVHVVDSWDVMYPNPNCPGEWIIAV